MSSKASYKSLVIVESPTKARTIRRFLGKSFDVISCMGHVRDLPGSAKDIPEKYRKEEWSKLGVNVDRNFAPLYCIPSKKKTVISELKKKIKTASQLYLATDEDREGESISWHLLEILKPKIPVKRMVFHEITKKAITDALENTRNINEDLVRAQEARRILDRLVGYTISPLLWKKIAYGLSAGRVQSVVVEILADRELARVRFIPADYWNLQASLSLKDQSDTNSKNPFKAKLFICDDKKVAKGTDFDPETGQIFKNKQKDILWLSEEKAKSLQQELQSVPWKVTEVIKKDILRKPSAPFITSTLQQDASRRFGWPATHVMRIAQALYEQGYITYMRTDSRFISKQAIEVVRKSISSLYGKSYLPDHPRDYTAKKVKGAQEAHEAIRPSGTQFQHPKDLSLEKDQFKLYDLIWKRTMASQMADSKQKQVSLRLQALNTIFAASGTTIEFPGFLKVYKEGRDETDSEEKNVILPPLKEGDLLTCHKVDSTFHQTKPAPRYTEASLIQTMEERGIGRPSTYAPTISTITQRGYVVKQGTTLVPTFTALIVSHLLKVYLPNYVESGFTSKMEASLDDIAAGTLDWIKYLKNIYFGQTGLKELVEKQEKIIDPDKARSLKDVKEFQLKSLDQFEFRVGKYGAYVCRKNGDKVCASIPDNQAPGEIDVASINKLIDKKISGGDAFGKDPKTGQHIYLLEGRYGPYLQLGDPGDALGKKDNSTKQYLKRASIPKHLSPEDLTLDQALFLLSLPQTLGVHPDSQKEIKIGNGQYGPYVVHDGDYRSIPKEDDLFKIDLKRALELLAQEKRGRGRKVFTPIKDLGVYDKKTIAIYNGRYGSYIKWGQENYSLPKSAKIESFVLKDAIELIKSKETTQNSLKTKKSKLNKAKRK